MKKPPPQFAGKVLSVVCAGEDTGQLIYDPSFEEQGGRLFLVGLVPTEASRDNWMEGLTCAIAWDTVQDYVVLDSLKDYLLRLKAPRQRWPGPKQPGGQTGAGRSTQKSKRTSLAVGPV